MFKVLATLAWSLLALGWTQRARRRVHVPLVLGGIAVDLTIVALLEFNRGVVGMAFTGTWSLVEVAHIGFSSLAVLLYLPTLVLGFRLLRDLGNVGLRTAHRRVATAALVSRTVGFACMWFVQVSA